MSSDFEMEVRCPVFLQDEAKDLSGPPGVVIKGPVHEFDLLYSRLHQQVQVRADALHAEGAHAAIEGAHAEDAAVGAASTRLQVDVPLIQLNQSLPEGGWDAVEILQNFTAYFDGRRAFALAGYSGDGAEAFPIYSGLHQVAKSLFPFAAYQGIHRGIGFEEGLLLKGDFRPPQDDKERRIDPFEVLAELQGLAAVPDINRKGDDRGPLLQQSRQHIFPGFMNAVFVSQQLELPPQVGPGIGHEAGQGQARVDVFAVKGRKKNSHGVKITKVATTEKEFRPSNAGLLQGGSRDSLCDERIFGVITMAKKKTILAVVADECGESFEYPGLLMAGMNGSEVRAPLDSELIALPEGSRLFSVPGTPAMGFDERSGKLVTVDELPRSWGGGAAQAVSAFIAPAYMRTLLPAADYGRKEITLPLWAYTAVGWCVEEERFYVAAVKVDANQQWEPDHFDDRKLDPLVRQVLKDNPENRLLEQLSRCALDYHCFAAKNLFFKRWEAPLPSSPVCNSRCLGCISLQEAPECCPSSQDRLTFVPTPEELCEIAIPHLTQAENAIVSFGQGCEGDPILQADTIAESVRRMRLATSRGTINFNSNASIPDAVDQLADAGIDSIRVSLNSCQEPLYNAYYRPQGYQFSDVVESVHRAKKKGLFTMLNYLVFPGVTDRQSEIDALVQLVESAGVDLVQMRNLNIDPSLYLDALGASEQGIGMRQMLEQVKARVPGLQYGYFNRTRDNFFPEGFETHWPLD